MSRRRKVTIRAGVTIPVGPFRINLSRSGISIGLDVFRR